MQKQQILILLIFSLFITACNSTRIVQPIDKGKTQVGVCFGGPVIKTGAAVLPIPLTSFYGAYGLNNSTTAFGSINATSLFFTVLQSDFGITKQIISPHKFIPGISVSPIANVLFDLLTYKFSFYPQVDVNAYWNYGAKKHLFYFSLNSWFELHEEKAHNLPQNKYWLPSIGVGNQWNNANYSLQIELKYIGATDFNKGIVVDYATLNSKAGLGFYVGLSKKF